MDEDRYFEEPCVCCDRPLGAGGVHINFKYVNKRAEWDWPAAGNIAYDVPQVYAIALVCDQCIEAGAEPGYVVKGEDLERVPVDDLEDLPPMEEYHRAGVHSA